VSQTSEEEVIAVLCAMGEWLDHTAAAIPPAALRTVLVLGSGALLAFAPLMVTALLALVLVIWLVPRGYEDRADAFAMSEHMTELHLRTEQLNQRAKYMGQIVAELQRDLEAARAAPRRVEGAGHPLYRKVGLDQDCPEFVARAVRRAYRAKLHPDGHPAHRKLEAERRFKVAEQAFEDIWKLRGFP
jgi:hypothetical protein